MLSVRFSLPETVTAVKSGIKAAQSSVFQGVRTAEETGRSNALSFKQPLRIRMVLQQLKQFAPVAGVLIMTH